MKEFGTFFSSQGTTLFVVLACGSLCSLLFGRFIINSLRPAGHEMQKKGKKYVLSEGEQEIILDQFDKAMLPAPAVSSITFFSGRPCTDFIKARIEMILQANPWLRGRIVSSIDENGTPTVCLAYKTTSSDYLEVVTDASISVSAPYEMLVPSISRFLVKRGFECMNKPTEPIFRVTVIVISDSQFAIVFSISHVIGDGQTFFKLHAMLSQSVEVQALIADRYPHSVPAQRRTLVGDFDEWKSSPHFMANLMSQISKKNGRMYVREVDLAWVEQEKRKWGATIPIDSTGVASDSSFVSTNDVMTSHLFRLSRLSVALMLINLRPKLRMQNGVSSALTDRHTGNYWTYLVYPQAADFATPRLIRRAVQTLRPPVSTSLPGFFKTRFSRLALVTNWASFYGTDVDLPGCEQLCFIPIKHAFPLAFSAMFLLFKPTNNRLAVHVHSDWISPEQLDREPYIRPFIPF